jgi:hypothetical protein
MAKKDAARLESKGHALIARGYALLARAADLRSGGSRLERRRLLPTSLSARPPEKQLSPGKSPGGLETESPGTCDPSEDAQRAARELYAQLAAAAEGEET